MTSRYKIVQKPNAPIIIAAIAWLVALASSGDAKFLAQLVQFTALIYWSYLEITDGINIFRRMLGVLVAVFSILSLGRLLT